jgi:hypothetical protein
LHGLEIYSQYVASLSLLYDTIGNILTISFKENTHLRVAEECSGGA